MKWTAEQTEVLEARGSNLLVAAAAGSGKTAVLVERIVRLVMDPVTPAELDNILVVTFTQAAALEMKERIRKAFSALAVEGSPRAREQLSKVADAPISTIHAFCLTVLREHFHQAGLEPGFRVGEQTECTLLQGEALDRLMDDCYGRDPLDPAHADLLDSYAGYRDDTRLREQILEMWRFSRTMPWPEDWLRQSVLRMQSLPGAEVNDSGEDNGDGSVLRSDKRVGSDFGETDWGHVLLEEASWRLEDMERDVERACRLAEDAGFSGYVETFLEDARLLTQVRQTLPQGWNEAYRQLENATFSTLRRAPKDADPVIKDLLQAGRKRVKDGLTRLRKEIFTGSSTVLMQEIRGEAGRMEAMSSLVQALDRTYARMKRRRNLVDFDDLEHLTLKLLRKQVGDETLPSELAASMRERWHSVMIDEYQDSNLVQEAILTAIATQTPERGNLFMVGDVKQSIYRFRQAMPELFLSKYAVYERFPSRGNAGVVGCPAYKILLHRNFRSRKPILDAVNLAFSRLMTPQLGEMSYTEEEALIPGAGFPHLDGAPGATVSLCLIDTISSLSDMHGDADSQQPHEGNVDLDTGAEADAGPDTGAGTEVDAEGYTEEDAASLEGIQEEAAWAAETVRRLVEGNTQNPPASVTGADGTLRPVRYRDCAILMRATSNASQVFVEEFALAGIPLFSDTGAGYFASVEVGVVLSFLQMLDNPRQDIPLAAVLRSPLYDWGETMLADIRKSAPEVDFLDAIRTYAGPFSDACGRFLLDLDLWRERARMLPVGALLERMYDETGYALHVAGLPQGRRRVANLRLLVDRAGRFEASGFRGLFQFIRYVDRLRLAKGDMDGAKIIGEGEDVVRLMSIHKSKGLEFPVVLLCGTGKQFNLRDRNRRILMHHRYGLGPDAVQTEEGSTWATAAKRALQAVSLREMLSEEMRILYVALTRARERLLVCGRMKAPLKALEELLDNPREGALPPGVVLPLRSHAMWLLAAWGPVFSDAESPVRLEVLSRETLLSWRRRWVLPASEEKFVAPASPIGHEPFSSIPDGQISLFEVTPQEKARQMEAKNLEEVHRRLSWKAPWPKLSALPSKMTVTALKRLWEEQDGAAARLEEAFRIACTLPEEQAALAAETAEVAAQELMEEPFVLPVFMQAGTSREGEASGFRYGTLMHLVLQHLNPVSGSRPDVESTIRMLVERGQIPANQAHVPNRKVLADFVNSALFERMCRAGRIYRETPFTIQMPAADILRDPSVPANESVVMQGIVDCWFVEDDGIVLVDYKTDRTMDRVPAYRRQLSWYAAALEKSVGLPVRERILWFLHHGLAV